MIINLKVFTDPRRLAWATWSLLANNAVNKTMYLAFCLVDLLLIIYYSFVLIQRVHFTNFKLEMMPGTSANQTEPLDALKMEANKKSGVSLWFLRDIDAQLDGLVRTQIKSFVTVTGVILAICVLVLLSIVIRCFTLVNHVGLEKGSLIRRWLCYLLVAFQTFLFMPVLDIIIRTMFTQNVPADAEMSEISRYIIGTAALLFLAILMAYIVRIFNVCVPADLIPWCSPISQILFLNLAIKTVLVASVATDRSGTLALYEVIVLFLLQTFQASYRLLFAPSYLKEVDMFVKTKDFTVALIFFIGLVCKVLGDTQNYDFVYFLIFIPVVTVGWSQFEQHRMEGIIKKIKTRGLKMEIEYEIALYVMMTLVRDSMEDKISNQKIFGQLMDLMLVHIEDCEDPLCICDEMENFYELLRLKQLHNQEVFPLIREERKRYKKIIDDQGLIGTVSNLTDLTLRQKTTETSSMKTNNAEQEREDLRDDSQAAKKTTKGKKETKQSKGKPASGNNRPSKPRSIYKININETKHRFLSELLYLYYYEMKNRFPYSFKIQLLSNYFALEYKKKEMLCVFQMRSFNKAKLSKIDQCCYYLNEQYLLNEIAKVQRVQMYQQQGQLEGNFNGEYFIKMNQLYKEFNLSVESLSTTIVNFWRVFDRPSIDVALTSKMGTSIATNIKDVFRIFQELDGLKILKDYQMYFQFAIVQLHILNDPMAYELYIGKMRSILEINKVYQKNFSNEKNSDYSNFIIVDANSTRFGQLIQMNNTLRQLLEWSEQDVKNNRIESFMPSLIREKHPDFMVRYNKTGQSYIINNKTTMFLKKANGYVMPVELYIKFHYSIDYEYTFLAIVKLFYEMSPYTNLVKYNTSQLMFFMVDNISGEIAEYSESCKEVLKFKRMEDQDGIIKRIGDFIIDFDFMSFRQSRQERYMTGEIYEETHHIDVKYFDNSSDSIFNYQMAPSADDAQSGGGRSGYTASAQGRIATVKTRVFEERYSGGILDINIFCLHLIQEGDRTTMQGSSAIGTSTAQGYFSKVIANQQNIKTVTNGNSQLIQEQNVASLDVIEELDHEVREGSHSVTASTSQGSSTTSMAEFRNFHSFSEQQTPKTLLTITYLIGALYLLMALIASINLGINLARQKQSEQDVTDVRYSFDRMNWVSMNQLISRVLVNTANGYEVESSLLVEDRFSEYSSLQSLRIQQLKNTQSFMQQSTFQKSDQFRDLMEGNNVNLYYLNDQNRVYTTKENMKVSMNLYIAKLTELNSLSRDKLRGNLRIMNLIKRDDPGYRPSLYEQLVFFIVENGNREMRQLTIDSTVFFSKESEEHAEQNITSTKVTAIISVVVIVIIGLVIAPILTKAEIRKYKGLLYFLKVPKEKFADMIKNCEYCINMSDEGRYYEIQKDYESFLGVKLVGQQVEQLRQAREERSNIENQVTRDDNSGGYGTSSYSQPLSTQNDAGSQAASRVLPYDFQGSINSQTDFRKPSGSQASQGHNHRQASMAKKSLQNVVVEESAENDEESDDAEGGIEDKRRGLNTNKFNVRTLNLRQGAQSTGKKSFSAGNAVPNEDSSSRSSDDRDAEDGHKRQQALVELGEIEKAKQEEKKQILQQEIESKTRLINGQAYKRRSTVIFGSLAIILGLSCYFLIAYFLAMQTFQTAAYVIKDLEIIFYKGSCFDSAMNFMRESLIRNESMYITSTDKQNAADYYIDYCLKKEVDYNKMRTSLPLYFQEAKPYFDALESDGLCEFVYGKGSATADEKLLKTCTTALNGILLKGLTNTFYYMYTQILKQNLQFQALAQVGQRTKENLESMMLNNEIIQIIDMKAKILDQPLNDLKEQCMQSVINYIQKLLLNFIIAFIIFILILTVAVAALVLLGFRLLRQAMWDTNIILKIIPFETLPKEDRIDIKDFFNS